MAILLLVALICLLALVLRTNVGVARFNFRQAALLADRQKHPKARRYRTRPMISIIMEVHNNEDSIIRALIALQDVTYKKYEIIIIDNASSDTSPKIIKRFIKDNKKLAIRLIARRTTANRQRALRDAAYKHAKGELIMQLGPNQIIASNGLLEAAHYFNAQPGITVATGMTMPTGIASIGGIAHFYTNLWMNRNHKATSLQVRSIGYKQDVTVCRRANWSTYVRELISGVTPSLRAQYISTLTAQTVNAASWSSAKAVLQTEWLAARKTVGYGWLARAGCLTLPFGLAYVTYVAIELKQTTFLLMAWVLFGVLLLLAIVDASTVTRKQKLAAIIGSPLAYGLLYGVAAAYFIGETTLSVRSLIVNISKQLQILPMRYERLLKFGKTHLQAAK